MTSRHIALTSWSACASPTSTSAKYDPARDLRSVQWTRCLLRCPHTRVEARIHACRQALKHQHGRPGSLSRGARRTPPGRRRIPHEMKRPAPAGTGPSIVQMCERLSDVYQIEKSSSFAPFFNRSKSQFGLRPRPVHVSDLFSGLAYFATPIDLPLPAPRPGRPAPKSSPTENP